MSLTPPGLGAMFVVRCREARGGLALRSTTRSRFSLVLVALASLLVWPAFSAACTPTGPAPTPKQRVAEYDIALYGVISFVRWLPEEKPTTDALPRQGRDFVATVVVTRVFKGLVARRIRIAGNTYDPCGTFKPRAGWQGGLMLNRPGHPRYSSISAFNLISLRNLLAATGGHWRSPGYPSR